MELDQWKRSGHAAEFRGHRVMVYEAGSRDAEPLLLIHGLPTAAWDWHRVWPVLAERYRLIAPDLLGFGFSDKPPDFPYSFRAQADLCEAILEERGCRDFHVLAHDYGDTVGQELLARRIEQGGDGEGLQSLSLLNGALFPEQYQPRPIQTWLAGPLGSLLVRFLTRERALDRLAEVFGPDTRPGPTERDDFWELIDANEGLRVLPRLFGYMREREENRARWVSALVDSPVPVLFIDGVLDPVSGARMTQRWRELLPTAPVVELANVGHYPHLEDPRAVLDACLPFFTAAQFRQPRI